MTILSSSSLVVHSSRGSYVGATHVPRWSKWAYLVPHPPYTRPDIWLRGPRAVDEPT